jgi:predicted component of type VI protein secretion system
MWSRSPRRRVPTSGSQIAFIRRAWTDVRRILVPVAWKTASNEAVKFEPRSRSRNLMSRTSYQAAAVPDDQARRTSLAGGEWSVRLPDGGVHQLFDDPGL